MNSTGTLRPFRLASRTVSREDSTVLPLLSACVLAFWIVGPSAMGSVKGRPSSMTSGKGVSHEDIEKIDTAEQCQDRQYHRQNSPEPPRSIASMISTVSSSVG